MKSTSASAASRVPYRYRGAATMSSTMDMDAFASVRKQKIEENTAGYDKKESNNFWRSLSPLVNFINKLSSLVNFIKINFNVLLKIFA